MLSLFQLSNSNSSLQRKRCKKLFKLKLLTKLKNTIYDILFR